jgi:hypothetical protein
MADKSTQKIIDKYKKKWRIKDTTDIALSSVKKVKREVGEIWKADDKWHIQKKGYIEKRSSHPKIDIGDSKLYMKCIKCNKKVLNNRRRSTEIELLKTTGKCLKCNADAEVDELIETGTVGLKPWTKRAVYKDSMGNIMIDEEEIRKEYGEEEYQRIKGRHTKYLQELQEKENNKSNE